MTDDQLRQASAGASVDPFTGVPLKKTNEKKQTLTAAAWIMSWNRRKHSGQNVKERQRAAAF